MEKQELVKQAANKGDWEQVYKLYDEIYPENIYDREERLPFDISVTQKACLMSENGKHQEALEIYNTALGMKIVEAGGENARGPQSFRSYIGSVLASQKKLFEALELLNSVLEKQIEVLGDVKDATKPDAYETRQLIADILERQGKLNEALEYYEKVYEAYTDFYGKEVDITAHVGFVITSLKLKIAAGQAELDLDSILKIVDYGPSVTSIKNHWDDGRDTVLHRAVRSNVEQVIKVVFEELIKECGEDRTKVAEFLNFENSEIQTPLTLAVKHECENGVRYLLMNGIEYGLDVNKVTVFGQNALKWAERVCNDPIKNLLLEYTAARPLSVL